MSRICPQCSQISAEATPFCIRCGYRFQGNEQVVDEDATVRPSMKLPSMLANADPAATLTPGGLPAKAAQPPVASSQVCSQSAAPAAPSYSPDPNQLQVPGSYLAQPLPQPGGYPQPAYGQLPYGALPPSPPSGSMMVSLQRAFAGKGVPVHHQSWLLDGKNAQPPTLRNAFIENVHKQGVIGVNATPEHLSEQGIAMEKRDYVKVQYNAASVFVYIAPMGSNLYVSRTSTVQQPISRIRVASLGGLFVLMLICFLFYSLVYPSTAYADQLITRINTFFGLASNALFLFFLFVLLHSVVSFLAENDFLAFFRPNRLSDFTLDTLSSIEHITDKSLRETLRQAGLDADEITKPDQSYAPQVPLRRF